MKLVMQGNADGARAQPVRVIALPRCRKGLERWNVAELGGLQGLQTFSRIELHLWGAQAKVVWQAVRFTSAAGTSAPGTPPTPLTTLLGSELREDLRGRFKSSTAAYQWALTGVIPRCNRRFAHTPAGPDVDGRRVGMGPFHGFDYTVMNRGVVFNLTHLEADADSFGSVVRGDKAQADLYRRILAALERPAFITGYGEPEIVWFALVGSYGHSYLHWGNNLSFHSRVPARKTPFRQKKHFTPETVQPEQKYYVCFVTSEGDSMKGPLPFFFGSWFDKRRGQVPMNWAIHPAMARFPAMLEYYYRTATDNDYFVGVQVYNHRMPDVENFAHMVRRDMEKADLRVLSGSFGTPQAIDPLFVRNVSPLGFFDAVHKNCPREGFQKFLPGGVPEVATGFYLSYWQRLFEGGWATPWQQWAARSREAPGDHRASFGGDRWRGHGPPPAVCRRGLYGSAQFRRALRLPCRSGGDAGSTKVQSGANGRGTFGTSPDEHRNEAVSRSFPPGPVRRRFLISNPKSGKPGVSEAKSWRGQTLSG